MPLHDVLRTIITDYPQAIKQPFAAHPLGAFIRQEAAKAAEGALGDFGAGLLVEGSAGLAIGQRSHGFQCLIPQ